ncbi:hypothetical protein RHMOL_Rhmol07G0231600 [Rhododendron molle]|uniref:Uncharacterized protein n=1 Tax=Rhododendron molle TaxID=49168 RepID=A0ACC0N461_RHOML|nr:hypothetical protein RHMOL_Rhmol07G0231600 [Rhododendron molle]
MHAKKKKRMEAAPTAAVPTANTHETVSAPTKNECFSSSIGGGLVGVIEQANVQINAWKSQEAQERTAEQHGFSSVTPIEPVDRDNTPLTKKARLGD